MRDESENIKLEQTYLWFVIPAGERSKEVQDDIEECDGSIVGREAMKFSHHLCLEEFRSV